MMLHRGQKKVWPSNEQIHLCCDKCTAEATLILFSRRDDGEPVAPALAPDPLSPKRAILAICPYLGRPFQLFSYYQHWAARAPHNLLL